MKPIPENGLERCGIPRLLPGRLFRRAAACLLAPCLLAGSVFPSEFQSRRSVRPPLAFEDRRPVFETQALQFALNAVRLPMDKPAAVWFRRAGVAALLTAAARFLSRPEIVSALREKLEAAWAAPGMPIFAAAATLITWWMIDRGQGPRGKPLLVPAAARHAAPPDPSGLHAPLREQSRGPGHSGTGYRIKRLQIYDLMNMRLPRGVDAWLGDLSKGFVLIAFDIEVDDVYVQPAEALDWTGSRSRLAK